MHDLIIKKSHIKIWLMAFGSLIFVALSVAFVTFADHERLVYDPMIIRVIGAIGILFFTLILVLLVKKALDKKPGLILDQQGFIDYSSALSGERVSWRDVTNIGEYKIQGQRFIVIYLTDPDGFLNGFSGLQKMTMKTNEKMTGSPLNIGTTTLKMPFDELMQQFYAYAEHYHNNN